MGSQSHCNQTKFITIKICVHCTNTRQCETHFLLMTASRSSVRRPWISSLFSKRKNNYIYYYIYKIHDYVVFQFYPWFKFDFPLIFLIYIIMLYISIEKTIESQNWNKNNIEQQHIYLHCNLNSLKGNHAGLKCVHAYDPRNYVQQSDAFCARNQY